MTTSNDLLITGGEIVDGSGAPAYRADLVLRAGRIAEVLAPGQLGATTDPSQRLDATGLLVTPGFIDITATLISRCWPTRARSARSARA